MRALVVGATGGLGSAFVELLAADVRVTQVTAWSRSEPLVTGEKILPQRIDLQDEATIEAAARCLGEIDLAIVATGLLHDENLKPEKSWRSLEPSAMMRAFEINTIGPALIAKHVLPLLPRDRRVVFAVLSARVGSISDNRIGGWYSYRASKAALNQLIKNLSIELKQQRKEAICVGLHPGTVDSALSRPFQKNVAPEKLFTPTFAAQRLLTVIDALQPSDSGALIAWDGRSIEP